MVKAKQGFSLIELLVVMVLIGIMATIVMPNFQQRIPGHKRKQFVAQLNALLKFATECAIVNNVMHRITVDFAKKRVILEQETGQVDSKGEPNFGPIKTAGLTTTIVLPSVLEVKNFYIQSEDELAKRRSATAIWFFMMPNGLAQDVIINFADIKDVVDGKPRQFGLVLNPFTAQFKAYDSYQKP